MLEIKEMKLKESAYDWARIPVDLPRENLILITAKTTLPTYHPEDPEYCVRLFKPTELKEAARSLAKRPVGLNHLKNPIDGAFSVDAQWNESTQAVEALLFFPTNYINMIRQWKTEGRDVQFSVEYSWRSETRTENGVEFEGLVFDRVDLLDGKKAGDSLTSAKLVESKRGLMEAIMVEPEKDIKQDAIQASIDAPSESTFFKSLEEATLFFRKMGEPFAGYKDFDDCVSKNRDKGDPKAYCATIMRKVEQPKKEETKPAICDTLIEECNVDDIPVPELEEAEKVKGYTPPEAGTLPEQGKKILGSAYASCRKDNPDYPKERCSKIAWGAVKNAGYVREDSKWIKKESTEPQKPEESNKLKQEPPQPMLNQTPVSPEKPAINVASAGAVSTPQGEPVMFGKPEEGNPQKNLGLPPEPEKKGPHDSPKKDTDSKPIAGEVNVQVTPSPALDQAKQTVEAKPEEKDKKIKDLEEAVGRLQKIVSTSDSDKAKAVKDAKKEMKVQLINELEAILPPTDVMRNFNRGGQIIAIDVKKKVRELRESLEE